jgi:glycosyltransferase involved in cell wall biosynthesis
VENVGATGGFYLKTIKLLATYPGMSKRAEMFYSLPQLKSFGVDTMVIACRSEGLHGTGYLPYFSEYASMRVYRPYRNMMEMFLAPWLHYAKVQTLVREFDPDIILSSQQMTLNLAEKLAKEFQAPLVLWIETSAHEFATGKAAKGRIPFKVLLSLARMPATETAWWKWIIRKCSAIITCNPTDKPYLKCLSQYGKPIHYIPWPIGLDPGFANKLSSLPKKKWGIYAGSLLSSKNIREFEETIPKILKETPTEKFIFIGHGEEHKVIARLRRLFGSKIYYVPDMPKEEVANLIASSWYAYTPARKFGSWQFIGDCWGLGTPLVTTYNSGYIEHGYNGLFTSPKEIVTTVNTLFCDHKLYSRLRKGGFATADERHPKRIAEKLFGVIEGRARGGIK